MLQGFSSYTKTVNSVLPLFLRLVNNQKGRAKCSSANLLYHFIIFHLLWPCTTVICLHGKFQKLEDKQCSTEAADPDLLYKPNSGGKNNSLWQSLGECDFYYQPFSPKCCNRRQPLAWRALIGQSKYNPKRMKFGDHSIGSSNHEGVSHETWVKLHSTIMTLNHLLRRLSARERERE